MSNELFDPISDSDEATRDCSCQPNHDSRRSGCSNRLDGASSHRYDNLSLDVQSYIVTVRIVKTGAVRFECLSDTRAY